APSQQPEQIGMRTATPETTVSGALQSVLRGAAPYAAAATAGTAFGGPVGGVAAPALLGVSELIVPMVNATFGTNYQSPVESVQKVLTELGVKEPQSETEKILEAVGEGVSQGLTGQGIGQMLLKSPNLIAQKFGSFLSSTPSREAIAGGGAAGAAEYARQEGAGPWGQVGAALLGGSVPYAKDILKGGVKAVGEALTPEGAAVTPPQTIREAFRSAFSPIDQEKVTQILKNDPFSADAANYKLVGNKAIIDNQAINAINQGWTDTSVATIKASSPEDKIAMKKMFNVFSIGEKNAKYKALNRPSDIVGQTVEKQATYLNQTRKAAGEELGTIAKNQLKNKKVDVQPAMDAFIKDLQDIGVSVAPDQYGIVRANLKNSEIQGDTESERLLNAVLERFSDVNVPDAFGVHTAKQFLDTQVSYGKNVANPLSARSERIVKGLRRNLNNTLNQSFPDYNKVNLKYSSTKEALDNLQEAVGTKIDLDSKNANKALGTAARKILSNSVNRVNVIDSLDGLNKVAKSYGMKANEDVVNQLLFANELDKMFGAVADTSIKGQMGQAISAGLNLARGNVVQSAQGALNLASSGIRQLKGSQRENAIKSMESLLKQETSIPLKK
ncbi:MAG: hypothetical protein ACKO37_05465, partial [Vampirovibrionales bacterium]